MANPLMIKITLHSVLRLGLAALWVCAFEAHAQNSTNSGSLSQNFRWEQHVLVIQPKVPAAPSEVTPPPVTRGLNQWLMRMHEASLRNSYAGIFVVSALGGSMSSSRIWHASDGAQTLRPEQFTEMVQQVRAIAKAIGRTA